MRSEDKDAGMSVIVRTVAGVLVIPITIFGLYLILHGHLTPGGGFPGGAVLATLVTLLLVAFGKESVRKILHKKLFSASENLGLLLFAALAFFGLVATFFKNFLENSILLFGKALQFFPNNSYLGTGGVIPMMNIVVGLEVFAALSLIILLMFTYTREEEDD